MYSTLVSIFRGASAPADTRIYAIGDVHGYDDALERMLHKIKQHQRRHPVANSIIVMLGDYSSRGPHSNRVMQRLAEEREKQSVDSVRRVFLLGDHDIAFKSFMNTIRPVSIDANLAFFLDNGGIGTLRSFGIEIGRSTASIYSDKVRRIARLGLTVDVDTIHEAQEKLRSVLPQSVKDLYNTAQLCFEAGDYFFVHAAVDPERRLDKYDQPLDIMTGTSGLSKDFPGCRASLDKVVVHGHSISAKPYLHFNQIGVDTGIYKTGILSCAVLEWKKVSFLQTKTDLPLMGQRRAAARAAEINPPAR